MLDFDVTTSFAKRSGKEFCKAAGSMTTASASECDAPRACREVGVVREVVEQFAGTGGIQDDVLDAGVEAVEVEDVAGGGRVAEPIADVLDAVSGRRDRPSFLVGGEVEVAERDQAYRVHAGALLVVWSGLVGR